MRLEVLPWAQVREGTWEGLPGMVTGWAEGATGASGTLGEDLSHRPGYRGVRARQYWLLWCASELLPSLGWEASGVGRSCEVLDKCLELSGLSSMLV